MPVRPFQESDLDVVVAMHEDARGVDGADPLSTVDVVSPSSIRESVRSADDVIVFDNDSVVLGYLARSSWTEEDGTAVHVQRGLTDVRAREQGIASALFDHSESAMPGGVAAANAIDSQSDARALLNDRGYREAFALVDMELRLDTAPIAPQHDHVVRTATPDDVERAWALNELVYRDRSFSQVSSGFDAARFIHSCGDDLSLWHVALENDGLIGFVTSRWSPTMAEVTEVTVHPGHRRRGLASSLLAKNLAALAARESTIVRLHTDAADVSGARSLYERFGFQPVKTYGRFRKSMSEST